MAERSCPSLYMGKSPNRHTAQSRKPPACRAPNPHHPPPPTKSVFSSAGIASDVAASALVGAANVFGTMIGSSLMDKQGRKSLLITSFSGMAVSMLLLSLSFTWKALAPYAGTLSVVGTVLYVLSFALGAGPVPALLLPEIFASRIRAKAVALSMGMTVMQIFAQINWILCSHIAVHLISCALGEV